MYWARSCGKDAPEVRLLKDVLAHSVLFLYDSLLVTTHLNLENAVLCLVSPDRR